MPMKRCYAIKLSLTDDEHQAIEAESDRTGRPISVVAREAMLAGLEPDRSSIDRVPSNHMSLGGNKQIQVPKVLCNHAGLQRYKAIPSYSYSDLDPDPESDPDPDQINVDQAPDTDQTPGQQTLDVGYSDVYVKVQLARWRTLEPFCLLSEEDQVRKIVEFRDAAPQPVIQDALKEVASYWQDLEDSAKEKLQRKRKNGGFKRWVHNTLKRNIRWKLERKARRQQHEGDRERLDELMENARQVEQEFAGA